MSPTAFAGIGGHHSQKSTTDVWLTPPAVIGALGGADSFDLDPCSPIGPPWIGHRPFRTARWHYCLLDDGLAMRWWGRVYLNPPYGFALRKWLARMAEHNHGIALVFARTDTAAFHKFIFQCASALLFIRSRINFHTPDGGFKLRVSGTPANAGGPSVLCAYGTKDADILAGCGIEGTFIPLLIPRSVLVGDFVKTWRTVIGEWVKGRAGPFRLEDIYRAFAGHPKAGGNRNVEAKIRQVLQHGPYRRVSRGVWEATAA